MIFVAEMYYIPVGSTSWYNLPREGGVAYAAQESWVQNETIKVSPDQTSLVPILTTNDRRILFLGRPLMLSVIEKFSTNVHWSRIYPSSRLVTPRRLVRRGLHLVEDRRRELHSLEPSTQRRPSSYWTMSLPHSSAWLNTFVRRLTDSFQSVHTAKWVVERCLKGDLVKGRTVILVVCATFDSFTTCVLLPFIDSQRRIGAASCGVRCDNERRSYRQSGQPGRCSQP